LKDVPLADPLPTDPYWKSLRGWENHETIERFINFVSKIIPELKDQVDCWITITEPVTSIIGGGYIAGIWSPGFVLDGKRAKTALHNLIEAHVQAYNKITHLDDKDANGDGISKVVGFTQMMLPAIPSKSSKLFTWNENRSIEATNNFSYFVNDYFLNAVVNGEEDLNYLHTLQRYNKDSKEFIIHEEWKNKVDFIGLDYYRRVHVYYSRIIALSSAKFLGGAIISDLSINNSQSHGILNDLGWEIYPHGLYQMIMKIKKQWSKPVFVTENGVADRSDRYRAHFIIAHLQQIRRAIDEGADVIGYLHWSFTDNYEWQEGYRPEGKFGLFTIDFSNTDSRCNLDRRMTIGAEAFKFIIQESMMENNSGKLTTSVLQKAKDKFGTFSSDGTRILV
jgi:beta-galactosidase